MKAKKRKRMYNKVLDVELKKLRKVYKKPKMSEEDWGF